MRRALLLVLMLVALLAMATAAARRADETRRHRSGLADAPQSAHTRQNPYEQSPDAVRAGRKLFLRHCADCHGEDARGRGKAPALDSDRVASAPPGDVFWFLTNGNLWTGMPSWSRLPEAQRWQLVTYLQSLREPQLTPR